MPATKALLQWLRERQKAAMSAIPLYVKAAKVNEAALAAGGLFAYEEVLAVFEPRTPDESPPEEPFVDPATRFSLRSDT